MKFKWIYFLLASFINFVNSMNVQESKKIAFKSISKKYGFFKCNNSGCLYTSNRSDNFNRHKKSCKYRKDKISADLYLKDLNLKNIDNLSSSGHNFERNLNEESQKIVSVEYTLYDENSNKKDRFFKCHYSDCNFSTKLKQDLTRHLNNVHLEGKAFKCDHKGCIYSSARKDNLNRHKKSCKYPEEQALTSEMVDTLNRLDEDKFAIESESSEDEITTESESDESELDKKDRVFKCSDSGCSYSSNRSDHLIRHKKMVHSNEKPFKCHYSGCNFSTKLKQDLTRHLNSVHLEGKVFKCDHKGCIYSSARKDNLNTHKKSCKYPEEQVLTSEMIYTLNRLDEDEFATESESDEEEVTTESESDE